MLMSCCSYSLLLTVGRILLLTPLTKVAVSSSQVTQAINLIQRFLQSADQSGMRDIEEHYSYNWNTIIPFIEAILSPQQGYSRSDTNTIKKLFFFSLTLELPRKRLQQVARQEDMLEYLTCLQWYSPDEEDKASYAKCLPPLFDCQSAAVPRLATVVRVRLAVETPLGFKRLQRPAKEVVQQLIEF